MASGKLGIYKKSGKNAFRITSIFKTSGKGKSGRPKQTPGEKKLSARMRALDPSTPGGLKHLFNKKR